MGTDFTKKMLNTIRENTEKTKLQNLKVKPLVVEKVKEDDDNFLTRSKVLMEKAEKEKKNLNEENEESHEKKFPITKKTPQFGDIRISQEEAIIKTIGEQTKFNDDSLLYYPESDDLVLNAKIPSMNMRFQFRYNDPGEGLYIWCDATPLNERNLRTIGKVNDAYLNWRQNLITSSSDLMEKLKKVAEKNM